MMDACPKSPSGFHDWVLNYGGGYRCRHCQKTIKMHPSEYEKTTAPTKAEKLKDLFTGRTLEGYVEAAKVRTLETFKGVTFYFETKEERERARELLSRHNFYFPYGPGISLTDIDDPDYMLELLAYEGFDTSKILVERG